VNLTNDDVREILRLLDSSTFDELRIETDKFKLTLRRSGTDPSVWTEERQTLGADQPAAAPASPEPAKPTKPAPSKDGKLDILPPLLGTFYRAPKPGAPPFVEVGSKVGEETVVGIIETMKLMNSVYAGVKGTVAEICAENGQFVEYGHVLMRVDPEKP
jgi:acetyl-CoA carboxylase biotin carboxyl carrier protein